MLRVAIVGASGYIGGELLRLLHGHPRVTVVAATSDRLAGRRVDGPHPNLRGHTDLCFVGHHTLENTDFDVLFLAAPHRETMGRMAEYLKLARTVIDLSGDFRLRDPEVYASYYGVAHAAPQLIPEFTAGLPEWHRARLTTSDRIAVPGCMATAGILAVRPLALDGLIEGTVRVDARTGSSGSGVSGGAAGAHAERSGALRVFAPSGHRHEAEIAQATDRTVRMTATGVEAVRGVQVLCHVKLAPGVSEKEVRSAFRAAYGDEPFVRVIAQRQGLYRLPEPKILTGSNFCDVGFAVSADDGTAVLVGALDNLVKGGAGGAVQCMNVRFGWPERTGLEFFGLHPN
ncbi:MULTISPECIES: N-acetyl-gamma-glutamyl-phosphate reductase [Streptomyces]|uniref:N-acetyl-gamma-glutamyl-phosphate reductase n=2 Tax=Streptomyces TaxID=1883 RepID=A0A8H9HTT8_9ACTN|nr:MULTISPECIES: N-acetyl-gamma-glutamyl-phosphate reductase [Streptomyces]MDQ0293073.1 N-acetyl-gamma-glutamyl-phosphate/LysW-gamma-L-alpha-aminoadipyl-6-phosphate reductase [Streptomyces sp. DSM 41037]WPR53386.1 N-acetyl-gamma-glutamyl-phosphate reductase [Streptomyces sp. S399]SUO95690.1 N-acetyl-gamma-glutamyl-phosphate reductase [Streptomyces griseus]GFH67777.1 N-acetyl-gamma-glutamyl-phosphate reductase [Streptomyces rutgersensis]GFH76726.1 N-acetyl-gamma-glutamyl-phosphate reductase [St